MSNYELGILVYIQVNGRKETNIVYDFSKTKALG